MPAKWSDLILTSEPGSSGANKWYVQKIPVVSANVEKN